MKAPGKICTTANAVSHFENRHFLTHRPPARPRGILCVDTIGSPHRGILCVEKIGSVAPELQEWPGTPSKPVKSTNGPFYWLTRKRAPPCGGTLWGDLRKNRLPARIRGWAGTATGGHIHVVHISHTHPPKELIQTLRKYLLGKNIELDHTDGKHCRKHIFCMKMLCRTWRAHNVVVWIVDSQ